MNKPAGRFNIFNKDLFLKKTIKTAPQNIVATKRIHRIKYDGIARRPIFNHVTDFSNHPNTLVTQNIRSVFLIPCSAICLNVGTTKPHKSR